ncbi:MAG: hypothetical protein ACFFAO_07560 [Candidatus Hermodarchaeota archaeon]
MEVFIEDVQPGTCDSNDPNDIPFDYWIKIILKNGKKIQVLDDFYNLTEFIGYKAYFVIYAKESLEYSKKTIFTISGEYISNYKFSKKKQEMFVFSDSDTPTREQYFQNLSDGIPALETENGIFLVSENSSYKDGEKINYNVLGFFLHLWYPIEE